MTRFDRLAKKKKKHWHIKPGVRVNAAYIIQGKPCTDDLCDYLASSSWKIRVNYGSGWGKTVVVPEQVALACRVYLSNDGFCDMTLGEFLWHTLGRPEDVTGKRR